MEDIIKENAIKYGLEPELIKAFIQQESNGVTYAMRYEPQYKWVMKPERYCIDINISYETELLCQKSSWGAMQLMGAVARELGFKGHLTQLVEAQMGIGFGCAHLANMKKRWPRMEEYISAYNAGSPRKTIDGKYSNQEYVDSVMSKYLALKK